MAKVVGFSIILGSFIITGEQLGYKPKENSNIVIPTWLLGGTNLKGK